MYISQMSDYKKHREFIHEFANYITISEGAIRRVKKLMDSDEAVKPEILENLEVALKYVKKSSTDIRAYRQYIHMLEKQQK